MRRVVALSVLYLLVSILFMLGYLCFASKASLRHIRGASETSKKFFVGQSAQGRKKPVLMTDSVHLRNLSIFPDMPSLAESLLPGTAPVMSVLRTYFSEKSTQESVEEVSNEEQDDTKSYSSESFESIIPATLLLPKGGELQTKKNLTTFQNIALFGGGPSSNIPLLFCHSLKHKTVEGVLLGRVNVTYYGKPCDSLLIKGRDPQKTIVKLFEVAKKYETFEQLSAATLLHYRYLMTYSKVFNLSLEETISEIYTELDLRKGRVLLYCAQLNHFVVASVSKDLLKLSVNGISIELCSGDLLTCETLQLIISESTTLDSVVFKPGKYTLEYLSKKQGDLHYASLLFSDWKDPAQFSSDSQVRTFDIVIDRSGFRYPDATAKLNLVAMNVDFNIFAMKVLKVNYHDLTELQRRVYEIVCSFLSQAETIEASDELNEKLLFDTHYFVVIGGGRAAGELARRLANDVIHSNSAKTILSTFPISSAAHKHLAEVHAELNAKLEKRKRTVVVIDHRQLTDPTDYSQVRSLISKVVFKDFLLEILRFDVIPTLNPFELEYYSTLYKTVSQLFLTESQTLKFIVSIQTSLKSLLKQEKAIPHYHLLLTSSRDYENWTEETHKKLHQFGQTKKVKVIHIGGAEHICYSKETEERMQKYVLGRIQDSHYRNENLPLLTQLAQNTISKDFLLRQCEQKDRGIFHYRNTFNQKNRRTSNQNAEEGKSVIFPNERL